ncbi:hypothetical protein LIER_42414 [Lithospermum erythrorhizon]|uniref:DUF4283 domain-containing protein n=1 Tax=Lithospermum erythrorhizon TaxID=34254 RepID=A0AAV3RP64_LITER
MRLDHVCPRNGVIVIGEEDAAPIESMCGFCLIGCFTGRFPRGKAVQDVTKAWGVKVKIFPYSKGWTIFRFHSKEDRDKFFDVPLRYWTPSGLSKIASKLGRPLYTDQFTCERSRASYARILVEIRRERKGASANAPTGGGGVNKGAHPSRAAPVVPVAKVVTDPISLSDVERRTMERIVCDVVEDPIQEAPRGRHCGGGEGGPILGSQLPPPMFDSSRRTAYHSGPRLGSTQMGDVSCSLGEVDTDSSSATNSSVDANGRFMIVRRRGSSPSKGHGRGEVSQSPSVDR